MARSEPQAPAPILADPDVTLLAVVGGFHRELTDRLLDGARARLGASGLTPERLEVQWVPGAFELPLAAGAAAATGRYAAVIALGAVVRGETPHFDYICGAVSHGLTRAALDTGVPIPFGVLTCDTMSQAQARAGGPVGNAGEDAADAAVAMINLLGQLRAAGD